MKFHIWNYPHISSFFWWMKFFPFIGPLQSTGLFSFHRVSLFVCVLLSFFPFGGGGHVLNAHDCQICTDPRPIPVNNDRPLTGGLPHHTCIICQKIYHRQSYPSNSNGMRSVQPDRRKTAPLMVPSVPKKTALCTTGPRKETIDWALCTRPYTVPEKQKPLVQQLCFFRFWRLCLICGLIKLIQN